MQIRANEGSHFCPIIDHLFGYILNISKMYSAKVCLISETLFFAKLFIGNYNGDDA